MKLVRVLDLVDKDIKGVKADLHSRNADGSLMYEHTEKENRISTLQRVYIRKEKGENWLRWEWDRNGTGMPFDCGFSGVRLDREDVEHWHILAEVE